MKTMEIYPRNPGAISASPEFVGTISKKSVFIFASIAASILILRKDLSMGWMLVVFEICILRNDQ